MDAAVENDQVGPVFYSVHYEPSHPYDEALDGERFAGCVKATPGATLHAEEWSFPPGLLVRFVGDDAQQAALEHDLRALPGVEVQGPWPDLGTEGLPDPAC